MPDLSAHHQSRHRRLMITILGVLVIASLGGAILGWTRSAPQVAVSPSRWPQSTAEMRLPGRLRVLFLGNSLTAYNGGLALIMEQLSQSAGKKPAAVFDEVARYGATWKVLCEHTKATEMIDQGRWDYVVLQDYSTAATEYRDEMDEYGRVLSEEIHAIGARPVFFMTWPNQDKLKSLLKVAGAYINVAAANHGVVAPVALAWEKVSRDRPKLVLYDPRDHPRQASHPSGILPGCLRLLFGAVPPKSPRFDNPNHRRQ